MTIYTLGHTLTGRDRPAKMTTPRPLLCDGERIGVVDSEPGPAVVGEMTADEVMRRFGDEIRRSWPQHEWPRD